jgi:hypothetical protein
VILVLEFVMTDRTEGIVSGCCDAENWLTATIAKTTANIATRARAPIISAAAFSCSRGGIMEARLCFLSYFRGLYDLNLDNSRPRFNYYSAALK